MGWAPKLFPYVKEYEIAHGIRDADASDEEEIDMPEKKHHGMCPVFIVIIFSMIGQLVVLKMHERSLRHLKTLSEPRRLFKSKTPPRTRLLIPKLNLNTFLAPLSLRLLLRTSLSLITPSRNLLHLRTKLAPISSS